ncbi:hypothetical protein C8R45DRAFT_994317 [Mycena sanguinolenta]|nr:hypothetical protein C8R45DRAFT_994317 [Mycena sanguinolenta]
MNGLCLGNQVVVRLHEPKLTRQEKVNVAHEHIVGQPRNSSTAKKQPSPRSMSQRERIRAAVNKLESSRQDELTDLLMSLPKRERAMCLFNVKVLRAKVADAKTVLDCDDDD